MSIGIKGWILRGLALFGFTAFLLSNNASAAAISLTGYSTTVTPSIGGDSIGDPGLFMFGSLNNGTGSSVGTVTGPLTFNVGNFQTAAANANVTSSFTASVNITLQEGATSDTDTFTFSGLVTNSSPYELTYSKPSGATATYGTVSYGGLTYETETLNFAGIGNYTFGLQTNYVIDTSAPGKTATLYAYFAPQSPTAPEPLSAGLTGFAMLGLLGFAARRKLQGNRGN